MQSKILETCSWFSLIRLLITNMRYLEVLSLINKFVFNKISLTYILIRAYSYINTLYINL